MAGYKCKICLEDATGKPTHTYVHVDCPGCGPYQYPESEWLNPSTPHQRLMLSGWVRSQNGAGNNEPTITISVARQIAKRPLPAYVDRSKRALTFIAGKLGLSDNLDNAILADRAFLATTYSTDTEDGFRLVRLLAADGWAEISEETKRFRLTPKGLVTAEQLATTSTSAQAFVAMSFSDSMKSAWVNGLSAGIERAGYRPFRIDNKEHLNGISDEIIAEIRRSKFLVADYTEQKHGVYFEAGFALGIGIPVIQTCHTNDFERRHFDIQHVNTLKWTSEADLATDLERRIRAVIGAGPHNADKMGEQA